MSGAGFGGRGRNVGQPEIGEYLPHHDLRPTGSSGTFETGPDLAGFDAQGGKLRTPCYGAHTLVKRP